MAELNNSGTGQWSETDANNTSPPPDGAPVGTFPNQAEGIWRAIMGALKRFWDRINGTVTTTGAAGAYVYTPANTSFPTAYAQGETYVWRANFMSIGGDTLNINSLGAKPLYKATSSGLAAIGAGDIQNGQIVQSVYDGNVGDSGGFQIVSHIPPPVGTTVTSIADATNGGLNFSSSTGDVTARLQPSDLATKSSPTTSDSVLIMDAADSNKAKTTAVSGMLGLSVPSGTILDYAGTSAPGGYLECDGSGVSRTTYAALFSAIGTNWGAGDGSTTFNVPNLNGAVTAGRNGSFSFGNAVGKTGGEYSHTLSASENGVHAHTASSSSSTSGSCSGSFGLTDTALCNPIQNIAQRGPSAGSVVASQGFSGSVSASTSTSTSIGNSSGGSAHNNVQPTAVVMKIVKT